MKNNRKLCGALLGTILVVLCGTPAAAGDMPKRKAGLWEMRSQMEGVPGSAPIQMCVDQASDNLLVQKAKEKPDCSTMDVNTSAGRTTIHAICKVEGSTMTMDGVFTGNFDSAYKGDMKMRYTPPLHGMSETHIAQEAKWLGACKPGQKPGDVIMPNMGNFNMNEIMKDPRIKEMMKRQQGQ